MYKYSSDLPILSVCIVTYGQEKYISQAIDSVLMQKTKYNFEILVAEDASPDNTREILKRYENDYPNRFKMLFLNENTYNTKRNAFIRLFEMALGKYIIVLEGDDYWVDENKIESQIEFLETHPDYIAVAHNCVMVDENSDIIDERYPECKDEEYTIVHWYNNILPGQTTTLMYKNPRYMNVDFSLMSQGLVPADRLQYYILATHGRIFCMQKVMSAYRYVANSGNSYSANAKYDFEYFDKWYGSIVEYARNNSTDHELECVELMRFLNIRDGIKAGAFTRKKYFEIKHYNSYGSIAKAYLKRWFRSHILRDEFRLQ